MRSCSMGRKRAARRKLIVSASLVMGISSLSVLALAGTAGKGSMVTFPGRGTEENCEDFNLAVSAVTAPEVLTVVEISKMGLVQIREDKPLESLTNGEVWSEEEAYLLAKIAMAEAEGEDTEGKALVIRVVLNRVQSWKFPDSIEAVLYQKNQFSPIGNGRFDRVEPNEDCWKALKMVEQDWDESRGALYFESESASTWHRDNLKFLFRHGNHLFYTEWGE